jgi:ABC-type branched-subunit amino acid transport system substrate-binding protein
MFRPCLLLLLLLHLLQPTRTGASAAPVSSIKELKTTGHGKSHGVLHLAAFLPYISNTYGNGMELALVMALEAINADPTVLVDVELRIHASNTGCSKDTAALALFKQNLAFSGIAGVLGDMWCSGASTGLAPGVTAMNLFQVSGGNTAPSLSDKTVFPNFLRTVTSNAVAGGIFADLCERIGLMTVGVVVDWSTESRKLYAQPTADGFVNAVAAKDGMQLAYSDKITGNSALDTEVKKVVHTLLFSGVRVVYAAFMSISLFQLFACTTHKQLVQHLGPSHNGVVWMAPELILLTKQMLDSDLNAAGCTRDEWGAATAGSLGADVNIALLGTAASSEPGGRLPAAWYDEYKKRAITYDTAERPTTAAPSPYAETTYDAVWMWALALDKMLKGTATASAIPLSKLSFPAIAEAGVANVLKTHLQGTSFDGASGRVTIEEQTLDRGSMSFLLAQISLSAQEGVRPFASYSQATRTFSTKVFNTNGSDTGFNISWPTLDGKPPVGLQSFKLKPPRVLDVVPRFSSPFGGETLTVVGRNFGDGALIVTVGGKVCGTPKLLTPTTISCITPEGEGANLAVQVTIDGVISKMLMVFAYNLPRVSTINREWLWHEGSMVSVKGADFVTGKTYCRLGVLSDRVYAKVVDRHNLECEVGDGVSSRVPELLYVSNDGGQRWVSGLFGNRGQVR